MKKRLPLPLLPLLPLLLAALLLCACAARQTVPPAALPAPADTPAPTAAPTPTPTPEPTAAPTPEPTPTLTGRALRAALLSDKHRAYFASRGLSGDALEKKVQSLAVDPDKKWIALTYDDGPADFTHKLLDIFEKYGVRATLFVVGRSIKNEARADCIPRAVALDCELGNHSFDHAGYSKCDAEAFEAGFRPVHERVYELAAHEMRICRAPGGGVGDGTREGAGRMGYPIIGWSCNTFDFQHTDSEDFVVNACLRAARDGGIVLLHDLHPNTVNASDRFIPALLEDGYQLVTVSELLFLSGVEAAPGEVYTGVEIEDALSFLSEERKETKESHSAVDGAGE